MSLSLPGYIEENDFGGTPLNYEWNDKSPWQNFGGINPKLERKLLKISDRGNIALAASFSEWIAWRMSPHSEDPTLFNYIEAVWACIIDWHYVEPKNNPEKVLKWKDWKGVVRGSMGAAAIMLGQAVATWMRNEPPSEEVALLANVVERVIPDVSLFRKWRNWALDRLIEIEPLDEDEPSGNPVPREALDPNYDFRPGILAELLTNYLERLDPKKNPYLLSPDKILKAGFKGIPYCYNSHMQE